MSLPHDSNPLARRWADRRCADRCQATDYSQRGVKLRLFVVVALVMLVLAVVERARDPQTWQWLARLDKRDEAASGRLDTRLAPRPLRTAGSEPGTFVTTCQESTAPEIATTAGPDPVERAWLDGWRQVTERLDDAQRSLLFEMLYAARRRQELPAGTVTAAADLLAAADHLWKEYQAEAFSSLATLPQQDQAQWVEVLRQIDVRWNGDLRPSLQAIVDGRPPTGNEAILLDRWQQTLDRLALARVEDDTLFLRPAERDYWLRLEGRVRDADPAALRGESVGPVGYLQLHKQPHEYRGKAVTIRGTVMYAYRVAAGENYLGVAEHYVLWIMPDGGPTSPIVVYALNVPPGFPRIETNAGGAMTKLHEEVRVTGFFLKRGAYQGKDATYTAPLVIANSPEWIQSNVSLTDTSRFGLGTAWFWPTVGASLAISLVLVGLCYWLTVRSESPRRASQGPGLTPLDVRGLVVGPSPVEALRQMEEDERRGSKESPAR